jgi:hypothetical protein
MIVAAHQPQYLPWLGYFDKIDRADVFVLLEDVQYKKNEWQNRNKIKTARGWQWLTVPVMYRHPQSINEVRINNTVRWQHKHRQAIVTHYGKAPFYDSMKDFFEETFSRPWQRISELNIHLVRSLADLLGIKTPLYVASELGEFPEHSDERLVAIAKHFGADTYLAGNGGRQYMDLTRYGENGIAVVFQDYEHPRYEQLFGPFEPFMSVIDLLLNHGDRSLDILRGCP